MNGAETNLEACLRVPSGPVATMPRSAPARRRWDSPQTVWIRIDYPEWGQVLISSFIHFLFYFIYSFLLFYFLAAMFGDSGSRLFPDERSERTSACTTKPSKHGAHL